MTTVNVYPYGARITHTLRIEQKDNPVDPTTLVAYLASPSGTNTGPFTPTKVAQGVYEFSKTYTTTASASTMWGDWDIMWRGSGAAEGSTIRRFNIASSRFTV